MKPSPHPTKDAEEAPPVKGKATDEADAEEKDEDGDDKVDEKDEKESKAAAVAGANEKVDKDLDQAEEEAKTETTQLKSLTKTVATAGKKSEENAKEEAAEVEEQVKQEAELVELKEKKQRLVRRREKQRCTRLFPLVFSTFKIKKVLSAENMCPCPGQGKGMTQLILDGVEDAGDYDKFVLGLFEKNQAVEANFQAQMTKYSMSDAGKLTSEEEKQVVSLRLVVSDDKVDEVMTALDAASLPLKSTDMKLSPLLKGKAEYLTW